MTVVPNYENIDPASLSLEDLRIITQNGKAQVAHDSATSWAYELRRTAQPILDHLYLGPSSIARDRKWLRENGITMLVAARDSRMADLRLMGVHRVAGELGIEAIHIDVSGYHELIRAFPTAITEINGHMLRVHRGQARAEHAVLDQSGFPRGKILVFCETGNDRSAGIVVAYLMAVLGMSMISACQFVHFKRFCVSLDDELRQVLKNYEEILLAQRTVHRHELDAKTRTNRDFNPLGSAGLSKKPKRGFEETVDVDMDGENATPDPNAMDHERYQGRTVFAPYKDSQ